MKALVFVRAVSLLLVMMTLSYFVYQSVINFQNIYTLLHSLDERLTQIHYEKQNSSDQDEQDEQQIVTSKIWQNLQKKLQNTVVQLHVSNAQKNILQPYKVAQPGQCLGSGFLISDDGEIATNAHVVDGATSIMMQMPAFGKHQFEVDLVGIMPEKDIALLKIRPDDVAMIVNTLGKMPKLVLGDSDKVVRSQEILALGYPLGQQTLKSTTGVISGRELGMIQMSAPINPGSSGGPSVNYRGEVIGINSAGIMPAQNVGYIIAINDFTNFLQELRAGGLIRKPYIGVYQAMATVDLVKSLGNPMPGGTYVVEVMCDSPLLGVLQPGDMIYAINGVPVDLYGELTVDWSEDKVSTAEFVARMKPGSKVTFTVYRKGKKLMMSCVTRRKKFAPIRQIFTEYEELPYEIFGGFVIMPLMLNHIPALIQVASSLARYADEKFQCDPALVITHVIPDSPAFKARMRLTGSVIKSINGKGVKTLDDLHAAILDSGDIITIETTEHILVALSKEQICKSEALLAKTAGYITTKSMQALLDKICKKS